MISSVCSVVNKFYFRCSTEGTGQNIRFESIQTKVTSYLQDTLEYLFLCNNFSLVLALHYDKFNNTVNTKNLISAVELLFLVVQSTNNMKIILKLLQDFVMSLLRVKPRILDHYKLWFDVSPAETYCYPQVIQINEYKTDFVSLSFRAAVDHVISASFFLDL